MNLREENDGLVVAEIELQHEDQNFDKPNWLGEGGNRRSKIL